MDFDLHTSLATVESTLRSASTLLIAYSFSFAGAVLLLVVGYFVAGLARRWVNAVLSHVHGFDVTLRSFFANLARYFVLALVVVMVLGQFGVQTASIIAAIGAIGLAIGLALQGTLQNIAAGVMLLVLRPFRIDEDVQIGSLRGVVQEIGLFATSLRTGDGLFILAPNSTLWNQPVTNYSRNGERRTDITIAIDPAEDIEQAERTLVGLASADGRVLSERPPQAFVSDLDEATVSMTLRYWTSVSDFFSTKADLTKAARQALPVPSAA